MSGDTIFALSSGALPAGVAVIRLSGGAVRSVLEQLTGAVPPARLAKLAKLKGADGEVLDTGLVYFFPGPASFTGEDAAELQVHGGRAVVASIFDRIAAMPGMRLADAGEFTRRAFLNGKLDLVEAESLADLINAETNAQRRMAVSGALGAQSSLYEGWRRRIVQARALIEAELDFADESDVPGAVSDQVWADVEGLAAEIAGHAAGYRRSQIIRDGFRVVLVGAPNAGKSSLLNALAQREAAIVSEEAGTTRDVIDVTLEIDGYKVIVSDTAGLREGASGIEAIGIERTRERARSADLIVHLVEAHKGSDDGIELPAVVPALRLASKIDLSPALDIPGVSIRTGQGIDQLLAAIETAAHEAGSTADILPLQLRHVQLMELAVAAMRQAVSRLDLPLELRAEDLRVAGDELGRIAGGVDVEDLLDAIFGQFCIGK